MGDHLPNITTPLVLGARRHAGMGDLLVRCIRNVAPAKLMMCLSFTVPRRVAEAEPVWEWTRESGEVEVEGGGEKGKEKRGREEGGSEEKEDAKQKIGRINS